MIRRLNISISQPSKIGMFMNDKLWINLLFVFIVSILCSIPSIIKVSTYKGFDTNIISNIDDVYKSVKSVNTKEKKYLPEVEIKDYKLIGTDSGGFVYEQFGFYFNEKPSSMIYDLFFTDDSIEFHMAGALVKDYSYEDLGLDNVDFNNLDIKDADFTKSVRALEYIFNDNKSIWAAVEISSNIGATIIRHFIAALIIAFLAMFGSFIPFKYLYKLAIYAVTIFQISLLFYGLFNAPIFTYIGIILAFVYIRRAMRNIIAIRKKVG